MIDALTSKEEKKQVQPLLDQAQTHYIKGLIVKSEITASGVRITFKDDRFKSYYRIVMTDNKQYISEIDTGKAYYSSVNQQTRVWSYQNANTQNIELVFQNGKTRKTLATLSKNELVPPKQVLTVEQNPVRVPVGHQANNGKNWTPTAAELNNWVKQVKIDGVPTDGYKVSFTHHPSGSVPTDHPLTDYWTMTVTAKGLTQTLRVDYEVYDVPKLLTVEQNPVRVPVGHPGNSNSWTPTAAELNNWVKQVKIDGVAIDDYTVSFANHPSGSVPTDQPLIDYWTMTVSSQGLTQTLRVDYEVYLEYDPQAIFKNMILKASITNKGVHITFKDDRFKHNYQIKMLNSKAYVSELTLGKPYYASFNNMTRVWHYNKSIEPNISLVLVDYATKKTVATLTQDELLAIAQK